MQHTTDQPESGAFVKLRGFRANRMRAYPDLDKVVTFDDLEAYLHPYVLDLWSRYAVTGRPVARQGAMWNFLYRAIDAAVDQIISSGPTNMDRLARFDELAYPMPPSIELISESSQRRPTFHHDLMHARGCEDPLSPAGLKFGLCKQSAWSVLSRHIPVQPALALEEDRPPTGSSPACGRRRGRDLKNELLTKWRRRLGRTRVDFEEIKESPGDPHSPDHRRSRAPNALQALIPPVRLRELAAI